MSIEEEQQTTIKFLREKIAESEKEISFLKQLIAQSNERTERALFLHTTAVERILAECKVSTDKAFYEHVKSKADLILSEHHSVQPKKTE